MDSDSDDESFVDDSDEEQDFLYDNGFTNADEFLSFWNDNIEDFLQRDEYIPIRGTALSEGDLDSLDIHTDIDGLSIRWKGIGKGLSLDFTHLNIEPRKQYEIKPVFSVMKKHLNLSEFSSNGLKTLQNAMGYQMIYHGGWETWLTFVPKTTCSEQHSSDELRQWTCESLRRVCVFFQRELKELLDKREAVNTLAKNNLLNVKRLFVLPGDQQTILCALERAIDSATDNVDAFTTGFDGVFFTYRFGEKCRSNIDLPICDNSRVWDICVHVGINVSNEFTDIFWNREGINSVVGDRGRLTCAMSLFECVNFQSNLDGRPIDPKRDLLEICRFPELVRFVQLYADIPHRRPSTKFHPVSASVIFANGILRESSQRALFSDALEYMSEIVNNFEQFYESKGRIEFVVVLPEVKKTIVHDELIDKIALLRLLKERPMILVFDHNESDIFGHFKKVGLYLSEQLMDIYRTRRGTGDCDAVWSAYQYECAVEKLLWGGPLCSMSNIYSVNLGVGLSYPTRSLTDQKGFLCLEASSTCCVDETSTPPLPVFTKSQIVQKQILRVFGLYNIKEASRQVLGKRVVMCLLRDLYDIGNVFVRFEDFYLSLKRSPGTENRRIVGGITGKDLAKKLTSTKRVKWPMVFDSVRRVTGLDNDSFAEMFNEGLNALELDFFPAVRTYDQSKNETMNWKFTYGMWVLLDKKAEGESYRQEAESLHVLVLCELEKRNICQSSHYENVVFPWMKPVLQKISEKRLSRSEKVIVLAFITGIALITNGCYANYVTLSRLERELPLTQVMLRMCEVLSKSRLANVHTVPVYKLHPSIPYKLYSTKKFGDRSSRNKEKRQNIEKPELIRDDDELATDYNRESNSDEQIVIVPSKHISSDQCRSNWTDSEEKLLRDIHKKILESNKRVPKVHLYREYQKLCREKGFKDRSLMSVYKKIQRMEKK